MFFRKKKEHSRLHDMQIAAPCPMNWDSMEGDERKRFCNACKLHVYNISELTAEETEALIEETEGRFCGRIFRRRDGTVLTKNCPVGFRRIVSKAVGLYGAAVGIVTVIAMYLMGLENQKHEDTVGLVRLREPCQTNGDKVPPPSELR